MSMSFIRIFVYSSRCIFERPTYKFNSFLGSNDFSTSALRRLRRKGFKTPWSLWTRESSPRQLKNCISGKVVLNITSNYISTHLLVLNHSSKSSELVKTSGSKKLRSAQSSWRLFCKGVPVISNLLADFISRIISESFDSSFFILWASSIIKYLQSIFLKALFSRIIIS